MGPLCGIKIVEFAGIGPGPFAGMMLADMGAEILRIDRAGPPPFGGDPRLDFPARGRRSIILDLKNPAATEVALRLIDQADGLIEGFRPGVMERLGLGPEVCMPRNPRLVYGRMTGWGQEGPLAHAAGHDINYIALSGALWTIGEGDRRPMPPINLVGDFGGGGMMLAFGLVCGILNARATGQGDVVDAAICDGTASLMVPLFAHLAKGAGHWQNKRFANRLDGAAPYYGTYPCKDGKYICIAPLEQKFYALLMEKLDLPIDHFKGRTDQAYWAEDRAALDSLFAQKTRDEWCALLEGTDVCFAPVLDLAEAPHHPHNIGRNIFMEHHGQHQPAPSPRFENAQEQMPELPPPLPGEHSETALLDWGFTGHDIQTLMDQGALLGAA